jgi:hypothetical protein
VVVACDVFVCISIYLSLYYPQHTYKHYNSHANLEIATQIYEKINPTPQTPTNSMHQRSGDNKVIIHHDESSYNATGAYEGGSKTGEQKCCNICPKAEECVGARCFTKCHKICGPQCVIPQGHDDSCTLNVDCGMVSSSSPQLGDQDMKSGYENMKAPTTEDNKAPKDKWARPPLPAKGEEVTAPSGPAEEVEEEIYTGTGSGDEDVTESVDDEETTMALDDEDEDSEMMGDEKRTVDVQQVPVETVKSLE